MKVLLTLALALVLGSQAQAGYIFDIGNTAILGNPSVSSPYAIVDVTGLSQVTFTVQSLNPDVLLGRLGFNGPTNVSLVSGPTGWSLLSGGQMDGFGQFDIEFGPSNKSQRLADYTFTVQVADASDYGVFNSNAGNPPGSFAFALEYFPGTGDTGYVGVSSPERDPRVVETPEPSSMILALTAGVAWFVRRRF
jgi:hypothetical protein